MQKSQHSVASALHDFYLGGDFCRETSCFVAEGMGVVSMSTQDMRGHVDFDFFGIWQAMKSRRDQNPELGLPKFAWMYHTHDNGCPSASSEDYNSVKGWFTALGMPMQMVIVSKEGSRRYLCLNGGLVVDLGYAYRQMSEAEHSERFCTDVLYGLSVAKDAPSQEDLDRITVELNEVVLPRSAMFCGSQDRLTERTDLC